MGKAAPLYEIIYDTVNQSDNDLSVELLCEISEVSRFGYYHWVKTISDRDRKRKTELTSESY